jgi:hypothetical protein
MIEAAEIVKRVRRTHERVTLIRPVLEPGNRRWQVSGAEGRFGASIKDQTFLENILSGHIAVPMVAGIEMDIDLETTEEKKGDVWVVINRDIVTVGRIYPPPVQSVLPLTGGRERESDKSDADHKD